MYIEKWFIRFLQNVCLIHRKRQADQKQLLLLQLQHVQIKHVMTILQQNRF
ncbi:unnamed protein product [Paramecium primaurelia]|uniref:Uncharacterized protein n=1 Tax=Paramecium primaurelia TaxID=5886 RepID=A0A8S1QGY2_PARPR|nr:unnamed protein product [Paramecium primaurelia]